MCIFKILLRIPSVELFTYGSREAKKKKNVNKKKKNQKKSNNKARPMFIDVIKACAVQVYVIYGCEQR